MDLYLRTDDYHHFVDQVRNQLDEEHEGDVQERHRQGIRRQDGHVRGVDQPRRDQEEEREAKIKMRLFMSPGFVADVGRRTMESIASERPKIKSARLSIRGRGRLSLPPGRSGLLHRLKVASIRSRSRTGLPTLG